MRVQVKTRTLQNFIGGKFVDSEGETLDIINPSTGEVYAQAPISTAAEIDAAFRAASGDSPALGRARPSVTRVTARQAQRASPEAMWLDTTCKSLETKQTMRVCNETPGPG